MKREEIFPGSFVELTDGRVCFVPEDSSLVVMSLDDKLLQREPIEPWQVSKVIPPTNNHLALAKKIQMGTFETSNENVSAIVDQMLLLIKLENK